ncbi:HNH endonuclease [Nocardia sp. CY41]|uniref:HNH endonuclease n=1 Tax=Nocardia sp. CY41 TaxID=2608686 RepID=UPI001F1FFCAC|nr:HNH endonuclease [Nocardia sp. CY41]
MARARLRICSAPGCPNAQPESRCPEHRAERDRHYRKTTPTKATRDHAERQRRAEVVADHRAAHGNWCPGWRRPAHPSDDLTADHTRAVADGGRPDGPLQVLCRACNSAKGAS